MGMVFCRGCGKEIHETAIACPQCGCQQTAATMATAKSQNVATLLAAFVGGLGIHRFYLNRPISGVFYLLLCWTGIPGFIALIETFVYAFRSQESWARKYNNGQLTTPVHILIKVLVLIFPVIVFIGITAAIAIPAYQQYKLKAEAARMSALYEEQPRHYAAMAPVTADSLAVVRKHNTPSPIA